MSQQQILVLVIFINPLILYFLVRLIPVKDVGRRKRYNQFLNFALIFTYLPVLYILYGLLANDFDTMLVLDGSTIYTVMMGITLMFGYIIITGAAIQRLLFLFLKKKDY